MKKKQRGERRKVNAYVLFFFCGSTLCSVLSIAWIYCGLQPGMLEDSSCHLVDLNHDTVSHSVRCFCCYCLIASIRLVYMHPILDSGNLGDHNRTDLAVLLFDFK